MYRILIRKVLQVVTVFLEIVGKKLNLEIVVRILRAFRKRGGKANLYQLYNHEKIPSSKSTLLKYINIFVDRGLLIRKEGKKVGALQEKIYSLTEDGRKALETGETLLRFFKIPE